MSRVVIKKNDANLEEASSGCPVNAFRRNGGEFVIDSNECIDCGICESMVDEGSIVEDGEASEADIAFNNEKAVEWDPAQ